MIDCFANSCGARRARNVGEDAPAHTFNHGYDLRGLRIMTISYGAKYVRSLFARSCGIIRVRISTQTRQEYIRILFSLIGKPQRFLHHHISRCQHHISTIGDDYRLFCRLLLAIVDYLLIVMLVERAVTLIHKPLASPTERKKKS